MTGLLGRNAIAATTVAVERVVLAHLTEQIEALRPIDAAAAAAVESIRNDEQAHHDGSLAMIDTDSIWVKVLTPIVAISTEAVIWLGMKL
jgi:ubiquinone biosynthesis monooxygenase Coq7